MIQRYSIFSEQDAFRDAGCSVLYGAYRQALKDHGSFHLVLSGGKTAAGMFRSLTGQRWAQAINWRRVHVWWSDERMVPPDHIESNYNTAWISFLSLLPIREKKIHRIQGEAESADAAARFYEEEIRRIFRKQRELPSFDLAILGVGSDGHTAGLFPEKDLDHPSRLVLPITDPGVKAGGSMVTLSLKVINNTASVMFFTSAKGKRRVLSSLLKKSIHGDGGGNYPAALVKPRKECVWHILNDGDSEMRI